MKMLKEFKEFAMNKLMREKKAAPTTKGCPFCCSIVDLKATKCPHCTSALSAV